MILDLTLRDIELSSDDQQLIEKKLNRHVHKLARLPRVKLSLAYNAKRNEATAQCRVLVDGTEYMGKGHHRNMLVALDEALAKVDRQTVRLTEKRIRRRNAAVRVYSTDVSQPTGS
ncbi:MAG: HPF/RaiA family ribosome-associated protein [Myxococcales bacterium]|nr:HPF/RaiA family ribosome-associated protein [Myxococcales bacterium]